MLLEDLLDEAGVSGSLDEDEDLSALATKAVTQLVKSCSDQEPSSEEFLLRWLLTVDTCSSLAFRVTARRPDLES